MKSPETYQKKIDSVRLIFLGVISFVLVFYFLDFYNTLRLQESFLIDHNKIYDLQYNGHLQATLLSQIPSLFLVFNLIYLTRRKIHKLLLFLFLILLDLIYLLMSAFSDGVGRPYGGGWESLKGMYWFHVGSCLIILIINLILILSSIQNNKSVTEKDNILS